MYSSKGLRQWGWVVEAAVRKEAGTGTGSFYWPWKDLCILFQIFILHGWAWGLWVTNFSLIATASISFPFLCSLSFSHIPALRFYRIFGFYVERKKTQCLLIMWQPGHKEYSRLIFTNTFWGELRLITGHIVRGRTGIPGEGHLISRLGLCHLLCPTASLMLYASGTKCTHHPPPWELWGELFLIIQAVGKADPRLRS